MRKSLSRWSVALAMGLAASLRFTALFTEDFIEYDQTRFALLFKDRAAFAAQGGVSFYAKPLVFIAAKISSLFVGVHPYTMPVAAGVFGVLTVPLVYLLAKKFWDERVGVVAAFLFALCGSHVWYCRIANGTPEAIFFFLAGIIFCLKSLRAPEDLHAPVFEGRALFCVKAGMGAAIGGLLVAVLAKIVISVTLAYRISHRAALGSIRFAFFHWFNLGCGLALGALALLLLFLLLDPGRRRLLAWPIAAGAMFSTSAAAHYSAFVIAVGFLLIFELGRPDVSAYRVFGYILGLILPVLAFQSLGYPSAFYLRDLMSQYKEVMVSHGEPFPGYFVRMLAYREGWPFVALTGVGFVFVLFESKINLKMLILAALSGGLFAMATLASATGRIYEGRMLALSLPFFSLVAARGVLFCGRPAVWKPFLSVALLLVVVAAKVPALREILSVQSSYGAASKWLSEHLRANEKAAIFGATDPWVFYLGENRIVDLQRHTYVRLDYADPVATGLQKQFDALREDEFLTHRDEIFDSMRRLGIRYLVWYHWVPANLPGRLSDGLREAAAFDQPVDRLRMPLSETHELRETRERMGAIRILEMPVGE